VQFVHEDDIVGCLEHAVHNELDGVFNCAADGVLALSEAAGLLGKPLAPVLPPVATGLAAAVAKRIGVRLPPEVLRQMRYGRALDNRRFKATGYRFRYTTRETILRLAEHQRVEPIVRDMRGARSYRYERELEDFLRYSPSVRPSSRLEAEAEPRNVAPGAPRTAPALDDLDAEEIIALLPSLDPAGLTALHEHERAHRGRRTVITAIERLQRWEAEG
jgi:UDP-glucose 4-epimerase